MNIIEEMETLVYNARSEGWEKSEVRFVVGLEVMEYLKDQMKHMVTRSLDVDVGKKVELHGVPVLTDTTVDPCSIVLVPVDGANKRVR